MAVLKTFPEILNNMISTAEAESDLTDFNPGSVGRTVLEAAALQDADQYVQIATIKDTFSIDTATGDDLDRRAEDYAGLVAPRFPAEQSFGFIAVGDDRVVKKISGTSIGAMTGGLTASITINFDLPTVFADFPATGNLIIERETTGQRELVAYTAKFGLNGFTLAAPVANSHVIGVSVILSQQGADQAVPALTVALVPPTADTAKVEFETTEAAILLDGDATVSVLTRSRLPGASLNVGNGRINTFQSKPFPNATVTNPNAFAGGRDRETDDELRERIRNAVASRTNGTALSVENAALQVKLISGQRVVTAQAVQPVIAGQEAVLYIDDGTGFTPTSTRVEETEVLIQNAETGQRRAQTKFWPLITNKIRLCRSTLYSVQPTGVPTITTAGNVLTDATQVFAGNVGRILVDANGVPYNVVSELGNTITLDGPPTQPIAGQNYFIFDPATPLTLDVDYVCDFTTGAIEFLAVTLLQGEGIVAHRAGIAPAPAAYEYYTGLLQEVQRVVNGDPLDLINYPGYKGLGARVRVTTPQILSIAVSLGISREGATESLLYDSIKNAVLAYVNSRRIGQNVVNAELIRIAQQLGATDTQVISPAGNIIVLDGQLARISLSNISVT